MKRKLLSLALALALCLGLSVPALAENDRWWEYEGPQYGANIRDAEPLQMAQQTFKFRVWKYGENSSSLILGEEITEQTLAPIRFPRGMETVYRNGLVTDILAYSDPDGDGVYDQRLTRTYFVEKDGVSYETIEAVPVTKTSVTADGDEQYATSWTLNGGVNSMSTMGKAGGGVKLTADYLTGLFGANTLVEVRISPAVMENASYWLLLTGETLPPENTEALTYTVAANGVAVSAWAEDLVNQAYKNDLLPDCVWDERYENGNYDYTRPITRAQFAEAAVLLYAAMQGKAYYNLDVSSSAPFTDTTNSFVGYAYNLGIVTGTGETTFSPNATLTREQAAVMLSQVYAKQHEAIPQVDSTSFADDGSVSSWAKSAVAFASSKGIVSGVGDNRFAPQRSIAIQEAAVMTLRMLENLK